MGYILKTVTRRRTLLFLLIAAILVAPVWFSVQLARIYYYQNNYNRIRPGPVAFRLEPSTVRPGESFELVADFSKAYDNGFAEISIGGDRYINQRLWIVDNRGNDVLLTLDELMAQGGLVKPNDYFSNSSASLEFRAKMRDVVSRVQGVLLERTYDDVSRTSGFIVDVVGCRLDFAPPDYPPGPYTDRQEFRVLPATLSGKYTVRVEPGAYCNGLPTEPVSLQLTVAE